MYFFYYYIFINELKININNTTFAINKKNVLYFKLNLILDLEDV